MGSAGLHPGGVRMFGCSDVRDPSTMGKSEHVRPSTTNILLGFPNPSTMGVLLVVLDRTTEHHEHVLGPCSWCSGEHPSTTSKVPMVLGRTTEHHEHDPNACSWCSGEQPSTTSKMFVVLGRTTEHHGHYCDLPNIMKLHGECNGNPFLNKFFS